MSASARLEVDWSRHFDYIDQKQSVTDDRLSIVSVYRVDHPLRGQMLTQAKLQAKKIAITAQP